MIERVFLLWCNRTESGQQLTNGIETDIHVDAGFFVGQFDDRNLNEKNIAQQNTSAEVHDEKEQGTGYTKRQRARNE